MFRIIWLALTLLLAAGVPGMAAEEPAGTVAAPGRILGQAGPEFEKSFAENWGYRAQTYEIYHPDSTRLARLVYALARHSGDIDGSLAPDRFVAGVKGFHYHIDQVCAWLNDLTAGKSPDPALDELVLAGLLLEDKILAVKGGRLVPAGPVRHVLGAAPGNKRTFDDNLRHERLHIRWDEDPDFREKNKQQWAALSDDQKAQARRQLPQYPAEAQLIEEWAVGLAEKNTK